ncbi:DUF6233 domain-containing protein [Streptomyces yangpuensis]|uniref:DUF6233 domain-containing protein n=1 Tax=Streptomyces yangpuensis TaxID=1648182 RepID=A0ABY5Q5Y0_9ACTN|nr:DUF6233 domain-containing protein [Streptomyces yangpuensis]UUY51841.1 DUF6233 domain-containing protein [Streptomyces yangpuensis]
MPVPRRRPGGAWLLDDRTHGQPTTVQAEGCPSATDRAHPLGTMQALDVLARPSTTATACTVCDAAEAQMPILTHGQDDDVPHPQRLTTGQCLSGAALSTPRRPGRRRLHRPRPQAVMLWLFRAVALNGGGEP